MASSVVMHGDCLELMKDLADDSVDMVLCDLPYGTTACAWDSVIPFDRLWEQYRRVIKENGAILLFGSQPFTSALGAVATAMQVRRLTPTECERLQGFPDGYTAILYRNKPATDGPRYKALGNSMAVPVMRHIGIKIMGAVWN